MGYDVEIIHPKLFFNFPCPRYSEIPLALPLGGKLGQRLSKFDYSAIHIATEGPLGLAARAFCIRNSIPFTTAYHTKFPEYVEARFGLSAKWGFRYMRWFHSQSEAVLAPSPSLIKSLQEKGFRNLRLWGRGVNLDLFKPTPYSWEDFCEDHQVMRSKRPSRILLFVGRVAVEKNIEAFLSLRCPGLKVVVGDGPERQSLQLRYPDALFLGGMASEDLPRLYSLADVFVFPSLTDTFGLVLLEALACGTPVAAFPVTGPLDVLGERGPGALDRDLETAVRKASSISREACVQFAARHSWRKSAEVFLGELESLITGISLDVSLQEG